MKTLIIISLAILVSACATSVTPTSTGGSRSDGVVEMSYQYGLFQKPQVDTVAALAEAVKRCETWGYVGAESFGSGLSSCVQANGYGNCNQWRVTTQYQCISEEDVQRQTGAMTKSQPESVASQEKYRTQVKSVADAMQCDKSATMVSASEESEQWVLVCADGDTLQVRCFDENCYVK